MYITFNNYLKTFKITNREFKLIIKKNVADRIKYIDLSLPDIIIPNNIPNKKIITYINYLYLHKQYNIDTYNITKCNECKLPNGMYIFNKIFSDTFYNNLYNELENTFTKYPEDPSFSYQENKKRVFLFDNLNLFDIVNYSHKLNPILSNYIHKIIINIILNLHISKSKLINVLKQSKLVIARYSTNKGIYTHIDNIKRSDGIVLTISVGSENNMYDLIPLDNKNQSKRVYFKQGEPVIMDGLSRFLYCHSIPNNIEYKPNKIRYSFIFLISKYNNINCIYDNNFFKINICNQNDYSKYKKN